MTLTILEKSLILSYLHLKQATSNMEISVIELKASNDPRAGKLQHRYEKLLNASRKAFAGLEQNIDKPELMEDLEKELDRDWGELEVI